jgi:hypothetical protein
MSNTSEIIFNAEDYKSVRENLDQQNIRLGADTTPKTCTMLVMKLSNASMPKTQSIA